MQIDATVLEMMDGASLQEFVPLLGDRIALRNFCTKVPESSDGSSSKKETLLQKLKVKLGMKKSGASCGELRADNRSTRLKGNQNA